MIRKIKETLLLTIKSWFVGKQEQEVSAIPVWFPATKDHQYD